MRVSDIMTTDRFTVTSDELAAEVQERMIASRIRHVLVVDNDKLVGIVSRDSMTRAVKLLASKLTLSDLIAMLPKITVKDVMVEEIVSVDPDLMVEKAVALAQEKKVGILPVLERGRVLGIVTNDDFFKHIINPILGIGLPGARIALYGEFLTEDRHDVMGVIGKHNTKVLLGSYLYHQWKDQRVWTLHLDVEDAGEIVKELREKGYTVEIREH